MAAVVLTLAACTNSVGDPQVVFHVYDRAGEKLSWAGFRDVQSNGWGESGYNDVLLDPSDLTITQPWPLYDSGDNPALKSPAQLAVLAFAWPSDSGYSQLLLPVPGPGTHNLNLLIAQASMDALQELRDQPPDKQPSTEANEAIVSAETALDAAQQIHDEADAASAADSAHDAAVRAEVILLQQYGQGGASKGRRAITLDQPATDSDLQRVVDLTGEGGWVRMVLDIDTPLSLHQGPVRRAQALGLRVVLQPVDSSEMAELDEATWRQRWRDVVAMFPEADEWETGNEVNGGWLGEQVAERVAWATEYVHDHTDATALVTLYWQLGEAEPENAMFDWLASHPEAVKEPTPWVCRSTRRSILWVWPSTRCCNSSTPVFRASRSSSPSLATGWRNWTTCGGGETNRTHAGPVERTWRRCTHERSTLLTSATAAHSGGPSSPMPLPTRHWRKH